MKLTEDQIQQMIRQAVKKQLGGSFVNEGPRHIGTIQKGMAAGKQAAGQRTGRGRYAPGEMAQQAKDSAKKAKQRKARAKKFKSTGDYLKKVFGDAAKVYSNNTVDVTVSGTNKVRIMLAADESGSGSVFIVQIMNNNNQVIDKQELSAGLGAKKKLVRFVKKVMEQAQAGKMAESKTRTNLETLLEQLMGSEQLQERHAFADPDGGMSQDEIAQHLQKSREDKERKDAQKKRAAAKQSMRGVSVECGPDLEDKDEERKPHSLAALFIDREFDESEEE